MALSNIFREPRREITESAVGVTVAVAAALVPIWIVYQLALGIVAHDPKAPWVGALFLAGLVTAFGLLLLVVFIAATHALGEAVCDALQRRGVRLRPRTRY